MVTASVDSETILKETVEIAGIAAPPFDETRRGDEVQERLRSLSDWQVRQDAIGNVIAQLGNSLDGAIWAIAHLDTVFAAEQELTFQRDGDVMKGPGIGDNSLGVAALLQLARELPEHQLAKPVVLVFSVGEEGLGDLRGVRALVADGEVSSAAAVIAVEGHGLDKITNAGVGSLRYRGKAAGPGGHSWGDRGRPSAVHSLVGFAGKILAIQALVGGDIAINLGTLNGGTYVTAIAAEAEITFEARSTSEESLGTFEELVQAAADAASLPIALEEVGRRPAGILPEDSLLVRAAHDARRLEGLEPAPLTAKSTDANAFMAAGIPAISVGLTLGRNSHHPSEEIEVPPIAGGYASLRRLILNLAAGS